SLTALAMGISRVDDATGHGESTISCLLWALLFLAPAALAALVVRIRLAARVDTWAGGIFTKQLVRPVGHCPAPARAGRAEASCRYHPFQTSLNNLVAHRKITLRLFHW